ncbi:MAG: RNA methyltransferase [Acidobacteriota bacterium]
MTGNTLDNISIILVETLQPGNIGSVARAMKNMGLRRLKLVNPKKIHNAESKKMAGKALDLIEQAQLYETFAEAVEDENVLIATTSARDRKVRQRFYTPRQIGPMVREYARSQRVALVFGSEKRGLSEAQIARCQYLASIPADSEHPVLNLAQSVMVMAYEIFSAADLVDSADEGTSRLELSSQQEREQMFSQIEQVLVNIGFLPSHNPGRIMRSLRRILSHSDLTRRDIQILRGIFSQVEWYVEEGQRLGLDQVKKR